MDFNQYQKLAKRTMNMNLKKREQVNHSLHGMVGEIGELHSIYQKIYQGHKPEKEHMRKELGDLLWFMAEYCTAMGWKFEDIAVLNIEKLKARFPEGFDEEKSIHRKEGDI